MRTNRVRLAAAASVLAFALTGCGGDDGGARVPTAGGGSTSAGPGAGTRSGAPTGKGATGDEAEIAAYVDAQRKWVACMRENGFDLPDPDDKGQVEIGGDARALKADPKFLDANEKCAGLRVNVPMAVERLLRPKLTPEQIEKQRACADCMQKNGAPDFPDPGPEGYVEEDDNSGGPLWDQDSAGAKRASRTCASIIGNEIPSDAPPAKG